MKKNGLRRKAGYEAVVRSGEGKNHTTKKSHTSECVREMGERWMFSDVEEDTKKERPDEKKNTHA